MFTYENTRVIFFTNNEFLLKVKSKNKIYFMFQSFNRSDLKTIDFILTTLLGILFIYFMETAIIGCKSRRSRENKFYVGHILLDKYSQ